METNSFGGDVDSRTSKCAFIELPDENVPKRFWNGQPYDEVIDLLAN